MQTIQSRAVADAPRDAAQDRQVGMSWGWEWVSLRPLAGCGRKQMSE